MGHNLFFWAHWQTALGPRASRTRGLYMEEMAARTIRWNGILWTLVTGTGRLDGYWMHQPFARAIPSGRAIFFENPKPTSRQGHSLTHSLAILLPRSAPSSMFRLYRGTYLAFPEGLSTCPKLRRIIIPVLDSIFSLLSRCPTLRPDNSTRVCRLLVMRLLDHYVAR